MVAGPARNRLPRMRQAYPQLDIRKAMSAESRGETLCVFYEEPSVRAQGLLEFGMAPDRSRIWLDGEIAVRGMRGWSGHTSVVLVPNSNGVQRDRVAMLCPECDRRCQVLTWVGSWRCRECDGLHDRRQLVGRDTLKAEQLAELKSQLSGGRRKGQHQAQFDRLSARAEELAQELAGRRPRMPAPDHRITVRSEWMSIAEYRERPSLSLFPIPSEERQRHPEGRLEELELRRASESRAQPDSAPPAPAAPKIPGLRFNPSEDRAPNGDDPDEISIEDM